MIASEQHPLTAITLGEVMATSDLPGGVVNVLTGSQAEIAPWLASHMDVNGIDLTGITDSELATDLEAAAADNLKRVRRPAPDTDWLAEPAAGPDDPVPRDQDGLAPDRRLNPRSDAAQQKAPGDLRGPSAWAAQRLSRAWASTPRISLGLLTR